ncbi:GNAT family N-acetyltransferase [Paenibacillus sp. DYY-L-2]|uniref:GNAT family N-acetyltransferase n=1 Tax=Paenibacillus sp. DYY-L-2 TaxID=3447013 RepID=UPI003F4F4910
MKQMPTIHLERLTLRPFNLDDAKAVQALVGDRYIAEMTLYIPHPYEDGMAEQWIGTHAENFHEDRSLELAIVHKTEKYLIGAISLGLNKKFAHGELAYWVGKKYNNKGYCTEAAKGMVTYAFEELNLDRVFARHFGKNPASGKVMEKIGMKYEGRLRQHVRKWGQYEDLVYYGLLRDEFVLDPKTGLNFYIEH